METLHFPDPAKIMKEAFRKKCKSITSNSSKSLSQQPSKNKNFKNSEKKLKKDFAKMSIQNESLAKLLKEKNSEIADLKRSCDSLQDILSVNPDEDLHLTPVLANHKLVEVCNQNRKLSCELLSTKNKLSKKNLELKQKELNLRLAENKLQKIRKIDAKTQKSQQKGPKVDSDKINSKNAELASQLKSAIKCLQMETGHQWDLKEFMLNPTNWQGRAKKIKDLEQQLVQYNEQIDCYKKLLNMDVPVQKLFPEPTDYETVSTMDIIKNAKMKTLEAENSSLRKDLEKQKSALVTLKVRNEALSEEVLECRTLISSIEQHSSNSKDSMASVHDILIQQQRDHDQRVAQLYEEINSWKEKFEGATDEKRTTKLQLDLAEKAVQENDNRIEELMRQKEELEKDLKSFCGGFLFSCRDLRKEEFIAILEALETEKKHLLSKIEKLENKISNEKKKSENLSREMMDQQVLFGQMKLALGLKNTESKNLIQKPRSTHTEVTHSSQMSEASSMDDSQSTNEYKIRLKEAEDIIQELRQKVLTLTAEKKEESDFFQAMIVRSKETILETIRRFSESENNSSKETKAKPN